MTHLKVALRLVEVRAGVEEIFDPGSLVSDAYRVGGQTFEILDDFSVNPVEFRIQTLFGLGGRCFNLGELRLDCPYLRLSVPCVADLDGFQLRVAMVDKSLFHTGELFKVGYVSLTCGESGFFGGEENVIYCIYR